MVRPSSSVCIIHFGLCFVFDGGVGVQTVVYTAASGTNLAAFYW